MKYRFSNGARRTAFVSMDSLRHLGENQMVSRNVRFRKLSERDSLRRIEVVVRSVVNFVNEAHLRSREPKWWSEESSPLTLNVSGYAEVGIWCSMPAALSTETINTLPPKGQKSVRKKSSIKTFTRNDRSHDRIIEYWMGRILPDSASTETSTARYRGIPKRAASH